MLQSGTRRSNKKFRPSHKIPSLPPRHPLELARIKCEDAITKYQALIHLEEGEVDVVERVLHRKHDHHRTIPIPIILKGEASSHVALADVLRLQSSWCHHRSINKQHLYLSARGETATELYEKATQCCDVAAGIAGTIGNHAVEAEALRALSDVAESRHVDDVAEHRLERAISLLKLISKEEMELNDKKIHLGLFKTSKEAAIAWDRGAIDAGRPTSSLNFPVYDVGSVGGGGVHDDLVTTTAAAAANTDCNVERKKAGGALP